MQVLRKSGNLAVFIAILASYCVACASASAAEVRAGISPGPQNRSSASWPAYRHDVRNTAGAQSCGAKGKVSWKYYIPGGSCSSPVVGFGKVYLVVRQPQGIYLYALDSVNGKVKWRVKTEAEPKNVVIRNPAWSNSRVITCRGRVSSPGMAPSIGSDSTVYVGLLNGGLAAYDGKTGKQRWRIAVGGAVASAPTFFDGTVYFGSFDGYLYAVSATDGALKWRFPTGDGVGSAPAITQGGSILYGSDKVYAIDAATGGMRWVYGWRLLGGTRTPVVVGQGSYVYICGMTTKDNIIALVGHLQRCAA